MPPHQCSREPPGTLPAVASCGMSSALAL